MRYPVRTIAVVAAATGALALAGAAVGANPQLAGLQVALAQRGFYTGPVDAIPGPLTEAAVRRFQASAGLVVDGIVGPETRRAIGSFGRHVFGTRLIRRGMRGWDVAVLQYLLARHRLLRGRPDGEFGPRTQAAVLRFQRARGLAPDGVVGPQTAQTLCRLSVCAWRATVGSRPLSTESVRGLLDHWAAIYGVDTHLVRGLAWQESGYQPTVVSEQGAVGVMQITPQTWAFVETFVIGHPVASTVEGNVQVGVAYLRYLLRLFGGDTAKAVGAYLQGPYSVAARGISRETQIYVNDVLALARRF